MITAIPMQIVSKEELETAEEIKESIGNFNLVAIGILAITQVAQEVAEVLLTSLRFLGFMSF